MDYLNEVRCNGTVFRWLPVLVETETPPKLKWTIEVARPLLHPVSLPTGAVKTHAKTYWKCSIRAYTHMLPLFEIARNLRINQGVFVRGSFYYTQFKAQDQTMKAFYGIMVEEIDLPHTKDQDCRVQQLIKKTIMPWKDKLKNIQVDEYGQKTITDGAIGKERIIKREERVNPPQEDLSFCDVQRDEGELEGSDI